VTSTAEWRIAHFSDTHVLSLEGATAREFLDKRATGAVNLASNRAKQYRVELFEKLLEALVAPRPDHTVCTGDLARRGPGVGGGLRQSPAPGPATRCRRWARCRTSVH
jgi:3',5'-cyclic AMP phosphodiesterase CpdA